MQFSNAALWATLVVSATAFTKSSRTFAVNHFYGDGPLTVGRMDPIVSPGATAGHVHAIQGGNAFALTMTDQQALSSTCTSSLIKNDKSNYWTPSLYFIDPKNGSIEAVPMFYMNIYYFFEPTDDKITAFEPGHRMVIGNISLRTPPPGGADNVLDLSGGKPQPVQWTCPRSNTGTPLYPTNSDGLHGVGIGDTNNKGAGSGFPDKYCDGYASPLRADIHFPSCYNPAAGLDNYKENMQFPTNNNCPTGWIHTPHLFYEVYWNTPLFSSRWTQGQGTQPFVLSNGDLTGYSLHGDFLSGWDTKTLQQIIDNCDAGDSGMDKCPGLIGGINDPSTSCNMKSLINEVIDGELSALPGNNPIGKWGVDATPMVMGSATSTKPASAAGTTKAAAVTTKAAAAATSGKAAATSSKHTTSRGKDVVDPTPTAADVAPTDSTTFLTLSSTTLITTTVSAPAETATPDASTNTSSAVESGWSYAGCYADFLASRVMTGITFANVGEHSVDNTKCVAYCDSKGFSMAGTEYGGQCFCDDKLTGSSSLDESKCNMACEGDATQVCGGSLALSVYSKSGSAKAKRNRRHFGRHLYSSHE